MNLIIFQAIEGEIEPSLFEESVVDSPNVVMKVTERGGGDVNSAQVGDPLELHFEIFDEQSPYEIFVRDLVAKDGNDQTQIVLIDSNGCPTEGQIMGPLVKDQNTNKILLSNFDAFKFPTSEVVQFRAHVTPCMPTCEPVDCAYDDYYGSGGKTSVKSYGRKKRSDSTMSKLRRDTGEKVLVTNSFVVMDKFYQNGMNKKKTPSPTSPHSEVRKPATEEQQNQQPLPWSIPGLETAPTAHDFSFDIRESTTTTTVKEKNQQLEQEVCLNATGIIVAIAMFLVLQIILVILWTQFWQRKKKMNREKGDISMFNPYAIRS
jgi:hypothetical protein